MLIQSRRTTSSVNISYYVYTLCERLALSFFILLSLLSIIMAKMDHMVVKSINYVILEISRPVIVVVETPLEIMNDFFVNLKELIRLKHQNTELRVINQRLTTFYDYAIHLRYENIKLKELLNFSENKEISYQLAYSISNIHSLYSDSILINTGENAGIHKGQLVIGSKGVIGIVVDVYRDLSRVMLITSVNSKIPVVLIRSQVKGVLVGNNQKDPHLIYLSNNHGIKKGDQVFTSGDGGMLPRGVFVGIVDNVDDNNIGIELAEDLSRIDWVLVVSYE